MTNNEKKPAVTFDGKTLTIEATKHTLDLLWWALHERFTTLMKLIDKAREEGKKVLENYYLENLLECNKISSSICDFMNMEGNKQ